jgi:hypothetical protein
VGGPRRSHTADLARYTLAIERPMAATLLGGSCQFVRERCWLSASRALSTVQTVERAKASAIAPSGWSVNQSVVANPSRMKLPMMNASRVLVGRE